MPKIDLFPSLANALYDYAPGASRIRPRVVAVRGSESQQLITASADFGAAIAPALWRSVGAPRRRGTGCADVRHRQAA